MVKCVAAAGPYAASGGADDCIHLYDLKVGRGLSQCLPCHQKESAGVPPLLMLGQRQAGWPCEADLHLHECAERGKAARLDLLRTALPSTAARWLAPSAHHPNQALLRLCPLYITQNDKDLGFLMSPGEGAVTALAFFTPPGAYAPSHLLSGAADGSITVWSVGGGWEAMKTMRGHRKDVSAIAVHPSGMLALSVSRCAGLGQSGQQAGGAGW